MQGRQINGQYAIMIVGIPGSGKSLFAKQFSKSFNMPYIDIKKINDQAKNDRATSKLVDMMLKELTKTKKSLILEGIGASRTQRTEFALWAKKLGYAPIYIWVQLDLATAIDRVVEDKSHTQADFDLFMKKFSAPHPSEKPIVISGKHTYSSQVRSVLRRLGDENRTTISPGLPAERNHTTASQPIRVRPR